MEEPDIEPPPVPVPERLRLLAWGALLLIACHVLTVAGLVRTYHCLHLDPESFFCAWVRNSLKVSGQIFGAMQWVLLTLRYWLPRSGGANASAPESEAP